MIPKKEQKWSSDNEDFGFEQKNFEPWALQGERYVKLLLTMEVVRIWFPKRW
jgi:hypothetical protein